MTYQNKYLKYKNKYLKYKNKYNILKEYNLLNNQVGGVLCNLSEWEEISNNGQHNCGIFIHKTNPSLIMKCGGRLSEDVRIINSQVSIFPNEYSECNDENGRTYLIMERLDNDITHILFNLLPMMVLNKMGLHRDLIMDIKQMFDIKTPTSIKPIIPLEAQDNILASMRDITLELYDTFIDHLITEWNTYYIIIMKEIIKVLLKLIDLNYKYIDMKFDNFGYKLSNIIIDTDYRKGNVPKLFDKYFYVYILDPASGLYPIVDINDTLEHYLKLKKKREYKSEDIAITIYNLQQQINLDELNLIYNNYILIKEKQSIISGMLRDGFDLNVHGQYYISMMNKSIVGITLETNELMPFPNYYTNETKRILNKPYRYQLNKYTFNTVEELTTFLYLPILRPLLIQPPMQLPKPPVPPRVGKSARKSYIFEAGMV